MSLTKLSAGKNPPEEVNVLIEIPKGSQIKYEMDKDSEIVKVDRFSYTAMVFPGNYGFIPKTLGEDKDPLDALVISTYSIFPGTYVAARPIGMLEMEDEEGIDTKIICVPTQKVDPFYTHINDVSDLDEMVKKQIQHYFNHYKELEPNKWVKTKNFLPKEKAFAAIKKALIK